MGLVIPWGGYQLRLEVPLGQVHQRLAIHEVGPERRGEGTQHRWPQGADGMRSRHAFAEPKLRSDPLRCPLGINQDLFTGTW